MGSSPTGGAYLLWSYGVMVSTQDSESCDPGSNPGRTSFYPQQYDTLAEWLRRVIRNHMGFPRAGSNPAGVADFATLILSGRLWSRGYDVRFPTVRPGFDSRQAHLLILSLLGRVV